MIRIILILCITTLSGCATTLETVYVPTENSGWKVGYGTNKLGTTIIEYIPSNESIDNWSKLLTIQLLEGKNRSPLLFMEDLKTRMQVRCPGSFWNIIKQDSTSTLYEWKIADCGDNPNQHEIARLLKGNDALHRIAYTAITQITETERAKWLKAFSEAYVEKSGQRVIVNP